MLDFLHQERSMIDLSWVKKIAEVTTTNDEESGTLTH